MDARDCAELCLAFPLLTSLAHPHRLIAFRLSKLTYFGGKGALLLRIRTIKAHIC
jgi:hypothetical protein